MITWWRRWRHRRSCFHGEPARGADDGLSFVVALAHLDYGRKLWACDRGRGGCGKRWVV